MLMDFWMFMDEVVFLRLNLKNNNSERSRNVEMFLEDDKTVLMKLFFFF